MKTYIGCKIIQAEPASESSCKPLPVNQEAREGYRVIYPDGYESWSPKDVFETAYREVTDAEKKFF